MGQPRFLCLLYGEILICTGEKENFSHVVRGLRIKGAWAAGRLGKGVIYFFKASKRGRNSIKEIPPPSKLRA